MSKQCTSCGEQKPIRARGLCSSCYQRSQRARAAGHVIACSVIRLSEHEAELVVGEDIALCSVSNWLLTLMDMVSSYGDLLDVVLGTAYGSEQEFEIVYQPSRQLSI